MRGTPEIHILNPMENAFGGSEHRAVALARLLSTEARVKIWSLFPPDPRIHSDIPITPVDVSKLRFPRGGTLIVVGCYFEVPAWVSVMRPERAVIVYNVPHIDQLRQTAYVLRAYGIAKIDIVVAGPALEAHVRSLGLPLAGFEPSWIDLSRFKPASKPADRPFTVGRMSRDVPEKFHPEDPGLFRRLGESGIQVRIQGGAGLAETLDGASGVELIPAGAIPAEAFLQSLDVFLYRTSPRWDEAWGRVVTEAMACGLPVVVDRRVGAASRLESGQNGFVFESTAQAEEHLRTLRDAPALRAEVGVAARAAAEALFGKAERQRWVGFYVRGQVPASAGAQK